MSVTSKRKRLDDGEKLHRAIQAWQRAELLAAKGRKRTPGEWWEEYTKAMGGKRTSQYRKTDREHGEPDPRWVQLKLKL
jgi:hypothetical protein